MSKMPRLLGLLLVLLVLVSAASANSVSLGHVLALQNNGFTSVDLFTHPGIRLLPSSSTPGSRTQLSLMVPFAGIVPSGAGNTLVISALMMGSTFTQNFSIPAGSYPNFSEFVTLIFPDGILHAVPVSLSVKLLSDNGRLLESSNYSFRFAEVPEPASLFLLGTGILATLMRRRRSS
jgi:hypothetical protein